MREYDQDLDKVVASSDPITVVFELNEEMMRRVGRIGYVLTYAFWAGILVTILAAIFFVWVALTDFNYAPLIAALIVIFASVIASGYARRERPFLDEYRVLAGMVTRAKNWNPNPVIPEGNDVVERYLKYLEQLDDRFAYYRNKPGYLQKDFRLKTKNGKEVHFDAMMAGPSYPWDKVVEDVRILVRTVPQVTDTEVWSMKEDAEYALKSLRRGSFVFKGGSARIVLIQTGRSDFDEGAVLVANNNWVKYTRSLGGDSVEWSSPMELVAENPSGTYNFGTVFFT